MSTAKALWLEADARASPESPSPFHCGVNLTGPPKVKRNFGCFCESILDVMSIKLAEE